jgi:hypothetical protein
MKGKATANNVYGVTPPMVRVAIHVSLSPEGLMVTTNDFTSRGYCREGRHLGADNGGRWKRQRRAEGRSEQSDQIR